jgi:hypothetical protein
MFLAVVPAGAASTYFITVNTSSVSGSSGFLDFQFNPGNSTTQAATATVSNFTGGTLGATTPNAGVVSGTLPGAVTFTNSAALNEYFQGFTYGASFSFVLTLSGAALDTPNGTSTAGSTFGLGLYDSAQNPILTDQGGTTGFAATVDINLNGTTTATAFPVGESVVSFQGVNRPTITKTFGAGPLYVNAMVSLSFTITNSSVGADLHGVSFTDPLPAGLLVASPNGLLGTCNGTLPTATPGSNMISLVGATVAAGSSCTFSVNVRAITQGAQNNTTSSVTTTEGVTGDPAMASITVISSNGIPVLSVPALAGFGLLLAGLGSLMARKARALD